MDAYANLLNERQALIGFKVDITGKIKEDKNY